MKSAALDGKEYPLQGDGLDTAQLGPNKTIQNQRKRATNSPGFRPDQNFIDDNRIELDITNIVNAADGESFIGEDELSAIGLRAVEMKKLIETKKGNCLDNGIPMLGWYTLPDEITDEHVAEIIAAARQFRNDVDAFVSLGIGGSYLGIEATFKALTHTHFNQLSRADRGDVPEIYFMGQNLDPDFYRDSLDLLQGKRVGINVISKSGTTTETAIAFRILRQLVEKWAGQKAADYIIATTDKTRGALRSLAEKKRYRTFVIPDNIGGRYSVLSDVGLFGLAVAGVDIAEFLAGFRTMKQRTTTDDFWKNPALVHAAVRYLSFIKGKSIEVIASNSTHLIHLARWMEQLFPESEGQRGNGLWVSPSLYSEKLHANGQMVQDGPRIFIETFLRLRRHDNEMPIPPDPENLDGLNFLSDNRRSLNFVNDLVIDGPAYAHLEGGVPNMTIDFPARNAYNIGQLYFMMELSAAVSGYMAGINPFIQPGVEAYKKAMFALAGKPGFEEYRRTMEKSAARLRKLKI